MKKACNLCKNFTGFGAHWLAGKCPNYSEISMLDYSKYAENCLDYDTKFVSCCEDCIQTLVCKDKSDFMSACSKQLAIKGYIPKEKFMYD